MRWALTKKLWALCKTAFPDSKYWFSVPFALKKSGSIPIFDQEKRSQLGEMTYTISSKYGKTFVTVGLNGIYEELAFNRRNPITVKADAEPYKIEKMGKLVSQKYSGEELDEKSALLFMASGEENVDTWASTNGFENIDGIKLALGSIGLYKEAKERPSDKQFHMNERVRIDNPVSMEHNEMATVVGIRGDRASGFMYAVLVDGSSKPIWLARDLLAENLAGAVANE